jgi:hypothetical protein
MQALSEQMAYMARNQGSNPPPPPIESGRHETGIWCTNCGQSGHSSQFCRIETSQGQRGSNYHQPQSPPRYGRNRDQNYRQGGYQSGAQGYGGPGKPRNEFHQLCGRWHPVGQCWSENQPYRCSNCGGNHPSDHCRQPDKVIPLSGPGGNFEQQARDNMRGQRRPWDNRNDVRPPNLYYNYEDSRQTHQPPMGLQTQGGYLPLNQGKNQGQSHGDRE